MLRAFVIRLYLFSICFLTAAVVAPSLHANDRANINMGNFEVGGSLTINHHRTTDSNANSITSINLGVPLQFFILNRLSVGGNFSYIHYDGMSQYLFGPAATFYFAHAGPIAGYVGASVLFSVLDEEISNSDIISYTAKLGMKYFIIPSVALGPEVGFVLQDISKSSADFQNFYLAAHFSIHL